MGGQGRNGKAEDKGPSQAEEKACKPADGGQGNGFSDKEEQDLAPAGTNGAKQADFRCSFLDGNGHDGQDADAAHKQGNPAQGANGQGQDI